MNAPARVAAPQLTRNITNARHLVDQAIFSIHALTQGTGPTPMLPALTSISGALQQALAELGEVEAGVGLAVHVLGGIR